MEQKKKTTKIKKKTQEKIFEEKIKEYLREKGIYYFKFWGGNLKTTSGNFVGTKAGVPDLVCCINSVFVGLEIKQENGHASDIQIKNLIEINKNGGLGFLVYPKDFSLLKICIEELLQDNTQKDLIRQKFLNISKNF